MQHVDDGQHIIFAQTSQTKRMRSQSWPANFPRVKADFLI